MKLKWKPPPYLYKKRGFLYYLISSFYKTLGKEEMPQTIEITIAELIEILKKNNYNQQPAENALSHTFRHLRSLMRLNAGTIETSEGISMASYSRDALVVNMSDKAEMSVPNLLDFDRADKALTLIENTIADLCEKQKSSVRIGNFLF